MKTPATTVWILICLTLISVDGTSSNEIEPPVFVTSPKLWRPNILRYQDSEEYQVKDSVPIPVISFISSDLNIFEIIRQTRDYCLGSDYEVKFYFHIDENYHKLGSYFINIHLFHNLLMRYGNWLLSGEEIDDEHWLVNDSCSTLDALLHPSTLTKSPNLDGQNNKDNVFGEVEGDDFSGICEFNNEVAKTNTENENTDQPNTDADIENLDILDGYINIHSSYNPKIQSYEAYLPKESEVNLEPTGINAFIQNNYYSNQNKIYDEQALTESEYDLNILDNHSDHTNISKSEENVQYKQKINDISDSPIYEVIILPNSDNNLKNETVAQNHLHETNTMDILDFESRSKDDISTPSVDGCDEYEYIKENYSICSESKINVDPVNYNINKNNNTPSQGNFVDITDINNNSGLDTPYITVSDNDNTKNNTLDLPKEQDYNSINLDLVNSVICDNSLPPSYTCKNNNVEEPSNLPIAVIEQTDNPKLNSPIIAANINRFSPIQHFISGKSCINQKSLPFAKQYTPSYTLTTPCVSDNPLDSKFPSINSHTCIPLAQITPTDLSRTESSVKYTSKPYVNLFPENDLAKPAITNFVNNAVSPLSSPKLHLTPIFSSKDVIQNQFNTAIISPPNFRPWERNSNQNSVQVIDLPQIAPNNNRYNTPAFSTIVTHKPFINPIQNLPINGNYLPSISLSESFTESPSYTNTNKSSSNITRGPLFSQIESICENSPLQAALSQQKLSTPFSSYALRSPYLFPQESPSLFLGEPEPSYTFESKSNTALETPLVPTSINAMVKNMPSPYLLTSTINVPLSVCYVDRRNSNKIIDTTAAPSGCTPTIFSSPTNKMADTGIFVPNLSIQNLYPTAVSVPSLDQNMKISPENLESLALMPSFLEACKPKFPSSYYTGPQSLTSTSYNSNLKLPSLKPILGTSCVTPPSTKQSSSATLPKISFLPSPLRLSPLLTKIPNSNFQDLPMFAKRTYKPCSLMIPSSTHQITASIPNAPINTLLPQTISWMTPIQNTIYTPSTSPIVNLQTEDFNTQLSPQNLVVPPRSQSIDPSIADVFVPVSLKQAVNYKSLPSRASCNPNFVYTKLPLSTTELTRNSLVYYNQTMLSSAFTTIGNDPISSSIEPIQQNNLLKAHSYTTVPFSPSYPFSQSPAVDYQFPPVTLTTPTQIPIHTPFVSSLLSNLIQPKPSKIKPDRTTNIVSSYTPSLFSNTDEIMPQPTFLNPKLCANSPSNTFKIPSLCTLIPRDLNLFIKAPPNSIAPEYSKSKDIVEEPQSKHLTSLAEYLSRPFFQTYAPNSPFNFLPITLCTENNQMPCSTIQYSYPRSTNLAPFNRHLNIPAPTPCINNKSICNTQFSISENTDSARITSNILALKYPIPFSPSLSLSTLTRAQYLKPVLKPSQKYCDLPSLIPITSTEYDLRADTVTSKLYPQVSPFTYEHTLPKRPVLMTDYGDTDTSSRTSSSISTVNSYTNTPPIITFINAEKIVQPLRPSSTISNYITSLTSCKPFLTSIVCPPMLTGSSNTAAPQSPLIATIENKYLSYSPAANLNSPPCVYQPLSLPVTTKSLRKPYVIAVPLQNSNLPTDTTQLSCINPTEYLSPLMEQKLHRGNNLPITTFNIYSAINPINSATKSFDSSNANPYKSETILPLTNMLPFSAFSKQNPVNTLSENLSTTQTFSAHSPNTNSTFPTFPHISTPLDTSSFTEPYISTTNPYITGTTSSPRTNFKFSSSIPALNWSPLQASNQYYTNNLPHTFSRPLQKSDWSIDGNSLYNLPHTSALNNQLWSPNSTPVPKSCFTSTPQTMFLNTYPSPLLTVTSPTTTQSSPPLSSHSSTLISAKSCPAPTINLFSNEIPLQTFPSSYTIHTPSPYILSVNQALSSEETSPTQVQLSTMPRYSGCLQPKIDNNLDSTNLLQGNNILRNFWHNKNIKSFSNQDLTPQLKTNIINYVCNDNNLKFKLENTNKDLEIYLGNIIIPNNGNLKETFQCINSSIGLRMWPSNFKTVEVELKLKLKDSSIMNFQPIVKNFNQNEEYIKNIVKGFIINNYGKFIEVNKAYSLDNEREFLYNNHNDLGYRYNLLWPAEYSETSGYYFNCP